MNDNDILKLMNVVISMQMTFPKKRKATETLIRGNIFLVVVICF